MQLLSLDVAHILCNGQLHAEGGAALGRERGLRVVREVDLHTPNPPTKSSGFRVFDSSRLLILRGGILVSVNFDRGLPESLTQGLLIGKLLIGGLGVLHVCMDVYFRLQVPAVKHASRQVHVL